MNSCVGVLPLPASWLGIPEAGLSMSAAATISVDEFLALEQKVLQTVELIKTERTARELRRNQPAAKQKPRAPEPKPNAMPRSQKPPSSARSSPL